MTSLRHSKLTREIDEDSKGRRIAAFFDLDRTLISGFSAAAFLRRWMLSGRASPFQMAAMGAALAQFQTGRLGFSGLLAESIGTLAGMPESEYRAIGEEIFEETLAAAIYPESRALVQAHQRRGHRVAVVSSATRYQIEPIARELSIKDILCSEVVIEDGALTGEIVQPPCYGEGKAQAALGYCADHDVDLAQSYFYTDSHEDLPLLRIVGKPRPTNPDRRLRSIAAKHIWPVRSFESRGTPTAEELLRTTLSLGSLIPSLMMGLPAAVLDGNLRQATNLAATMWGELGVALAGINVSVHGEQHLWTQRPAVFLFNHQSALDAPLICKLLRRDFVGISKEELRSYPILGQALALAGTIFIDRFDTSKAVTALAPAVDTLRQGISIAIAPEGTRSTGPRVGRFKKGAFRIALQARVPVVPIVIHNALDSLPKHSMIVRSGTIDVTVLPPVSTVNWQTETLDEHIADVRRLFVDTLAS